MRAHIHADIGLLLLREAWRLGQNPVDSGRHGAEDVTAVAVALPLEGEALFLVEQRYLRIRNHCTRGVADHSAHGAEISLGERRSSQQEGTAREGGKKSQPDKQGTDHKASR